MKNGKYFDMQKAIETEDRKEWPTYYMGLDRIITAKEKEGNTKELEKLEKEWKAKYEKATPDPSEGGGEGR